MLHVWIKLSYIIFMDTSNKVIINHNSKLSILDAVRFIASIGIIILHSFLEKNDFMNIYGAEILGRWCVGLFFMISGFFMKDKFIDLVKYCIKILSVYLFWTLFYSFYLNLDIYSPWKMFSALRSGIIMPFWYFSSLLICICFVWCLKHYIKNPVIICIITGLLFIIALMGDTWINVKPIADFMNATIIPLHNRIMGVTITRDGIFNGSFYISIGVLLNSIYQKNNLKSSNVKKLYSIFALSVILHIAEIVSLIYFNIGERDVLLTGPLIAALLIIISFQYEIKKSTAILLRNMSTLIFVIHCFFLNVFQNILHGQYFIFLLTSICSILFAVLIIKLSKYLPVLKLIY